ncbi:GNAT family N-acetyltransferase [Clostridium sp. UBA6640]|uniref:GNAT family N-acetyltransferase n=1 Tax=Clostridium sp. UBA6640 TaxID=1946370 RepID=UPI0025C5A853|nr:GNAT family N-acetyltransferase [Clostridium sp. UBA6640]
MKILFKEFKDEIDALIEFLTSDTWEFYGTPNPKPERIRKSYENQYYTGDDCKTFWVILDQDIKVGMIRIYDLEDGDPLFDIRISSKYKGTGIGTSTVKWIVDYIFNNYSDKNRIEGNTRQDNYAMRCVFHKCGFLKESHYRKAWVGNDGKAYDAIGYGITKEDWQNGKVTPVNWNDFKC